MVLRRLPGRQDPGASNGKVMMAGTAVSPTRDSPLSHPAAALRPLRRLRLADYLFLLPALLFVGATMLYPVYANLRMSLYDVSVMTFLSGNAPFVGLTNYQKLVSDPTFLHALAQSLLFTAGSLLFQFTIGFALALFFNRPFPGNGALRALLLLAWLLPTVVSGSLFRWMLDGDYGVLNFALVRLGLLNDGRYWLIDPETALAGTILANVWVGIPFNMALLLAGLQGIPLRPVRGGSGRRCIGMAAVSVVDAAIDATGRPQRPPPRPDLHLQGLRPDLRDDEGRASRCDDDPADLHL